MKTITTLLAILILCGLVPMIGCRTAMKDLKTWSKKEMDDLLEDISDRGPEEVERWWKGAIDWPGNDEPEGIQDELPDGFDWSKVKQNNSCGTPDGKRITLGKMKPTWEIVNPRKEGSLLRWDRLLPLPVLPRWGSIAKDPDRCFVVLTEVEGTYHEAFTEWITPSMNYQVYKKLFNSELYKHDLEGWEPEDGHVFYVAETSCVYLGGPGPLERSNLVKVIYDD
jgi:hypothetical protein